MEVEYATISYIQLTPDILVPNEWPICGLQNVLLDLVKEIIMQNDYDKHVLQVDGIPAGISRYVKEHGFYYVFKKISERDMYGCYVYDITLSKDKTNNEMEDFSGTQCSEESWPSDQFTCTRNYEISCYQIPPRLSKRKLHHVDANAHALQRRSMQKIQRMS